MAGFTFCGLWSNRGGMSCYVTPHAPNIAAIRGLAAGPAGLAGPDVAVALYRCLCRRLAAALHTAVHCYQGELMCTERTAEITS